MYLEGSADQHGNEHHDKVLIGKTTKAKTDVCKLQYNNQPTQWEERHGQFFDKKMNTRLQISEAYELYWVNSIS